MQPHTLIICCSDAASIPLSLIGIPADELLIVRHIGGLVPDYSVGDDMILSLKTALDYAVFSLQITKIIILGHTDCNAYRLLQHYYTTGSLKNFDEGEVSVATWMSLVGKFNQLDEKVFLHPGDYICQLADNLLAYPSVCDAYEQEFLDVVVALYDESENKIIFR